MRKILARIKCKWFGHQPERWETTYTRVNRKRPKKYPANRYFYACGRCGKRL